MKKIFLNLILCFFVSNLSIAGAVLTKKSESVIEAEKIELKQQKQQLSDAKKYMIKIIF